MIKRTIFIQILACALFWNCTNRTGETKLSEQSSTTHKSAYNVLEPALKPVYEEAERLELLRSLQVWKDDVIIGSGYFQPYRDSLDHLRSGTKSIMSILIGIALDKKLISNVEDPISKYIERIVAPYSARKQNITIQDLLKMTSGFEWTEIGGVGFNEWVSSSDPIQYVLDKDIVHQPGTTFNYNSAGVHLLSVVLTEASGMSTLEFAKQHLFEPLGIKKYRWSRLRRGYYNGGAGLELTPNGLLKIGIMMQKKGMYNAKRIVSERWVEESTKAYTYAPDGLDGYGYLWWIAREEEHEMFAAMGFGGQYLIVHPKMNVVVAITSQWRNTDGRMNQYMLDLKEVMKSSILALEP